MQIKLWQKRGFQITFLIFLALILRLFRFTAPVADWHSFRQADTASVAWEYYQALQIKGWAGLDLLRPQYQDLGNVQSGLPNLEGWRMVEFPLISAIVAVFMFLFKTPEIVIVYRAFNIMLSLLSVGGIYLLTEKLSHRRSLAFWAAFFFATLPYAVFYSRSILPEVGLITGQIYSLLFFFNYLDAKKSSHRILYFALTLIVLSLTLLLKPVAVFLAPVLIYLSFIKYKNKTWRQWPLYLLALFSLMPLLFWRHWITNFPSGIPASAWLLQGSVKAFSLTWFRWLFAERSLKLILGFFGSIVALGSLVKRSQRAPLKQMTAFDGFCLAYAFSMALFLIIFATGNIQHDYYQNFILPLLVILLAKGTVWLLDRLPPQGEFANFFKHPLFWLSLIDVILVQAFLWWLLHDQNAVNLGQTIGWRFMVLTGLFILFFLIFVLNDQIILHFKKYAWSRYLAAAFSLFFLLGLAIDYLFLIDRVSSFYHINHPAIVIAGESLQKILPVNAKIIAPYQSDTAFLFQTRRRGWATGGEIESKIAAGANYYLTVNFDDEAKTLAGQYQVLFQNPEFWLIDLSHKLNTSQEASASGELVSDQREN